MLANNHGMPLYPTSTGNNQGLGTRSAPAAGMAVVDLGKRMNRILEVDETMGYAAVEPGVSFQAMADELQRRGGQWMVSTTTGPPQGGMLGNAMDKGAGYGPYFDHFGFSCGMEVVLGTGAVIRTGDGSIDHETALTMPPLKCAIDAFSGVPTTQELGMLKWRPGGGNAWFTPGTPMDGKLANEFQKIGRAIYEANGLDYTIMNVCGPRFARGLHVLTFNREDADESARAANAYTALADAFAARGVHVGRSPIDFYGYHMEKAMPAFREACEAIKRALDPKGVIAPGKYGIG